MKYFFVLCACVVLLGFGCQTTTPPPTAPRPAQPEATPPVIGGTERDDLGDTEQCIINGDCELGQQCIDGKCV